MTHSIEKCDKRSRKVEKCVKLLLFKQYQKLVSATATVRYIEIFL